MIIILEGADLTGKSSVAKRLSELTGIPQTGIWVDLHTPKPAVISVAKTLRLVLSVQKMDIIFDRSFMSEYIYGGVLGRETDYIPALIREWRTLSDCHLFILTADNEALRKRYAVRGDSYVSLEKIQMINMRYSALAELASESMDTCILDTSKRDVDQLSEDILKRIGRM